MLEIALVCVAADNLVKIWSPFTGDLIRNLSGHTKGLSDIAWSTDGVYLASASDDTSVRIWNVDSVSHQ
jgi:COMPASS component SWD3